MRRSLYLLFVILLCAAAWTGNAHLRFVRLSKLTDAQIRLESKYDPPFLKGVAFSTEIIEAGKNLEWKHLTGNALIRRYEALNNQNQATVVAHGLAVLKNLASSTPITWNVPATVDICAATPDFKYIANFVRTQALIGRYLIAKGQSAQGAAVIESIAYIGAAICLTHPERNSLLPLTVAQSIVEIAAKSFILSTADFHPDRVQAKAIGEKLLHAASLLPPLSYSLSLERKYLSGFLAAYRKQAEKAHSSDETKRAAEFEQMLAKMEPHMQKLYDPIIPLLDLSWSEGWPKILSAVKANEEYMKNNISVSGPVAYVRGLLDPFESSAQIMLNLGLPPFSRIFQSQWKISQMIEGARTVLAIEAFRTEQQRLPATLTELTTWWETPIGNDLFSGKPLIYDPKRPYLASVGPDQKDNTSDDIDILPLKDPVK